MNLAVSASVVGAWLLASAASALGAELGWVVVSLAVAAVSHAPVLVWLAVTRRQAAERLPPRRGLAWVQALAGVLGPLLVAIAAALALALVFVSALLSVFDGSGGDEGARVSGEVVAWVSGLGLTGLAGLVAYPIVAITGMAPVRVPANAKTQP